MKASNIRPVLLSAYLESTFFSNLIWQFIHNSVEAALVYSITIIICEIIYQF